MIYLFIGQDSPYKDTSLSAKDLQLKQIKEEFLPASIAQFNLDTLYAPDLKLQELQEKLLSLPVAAARRMVIIKDAQELPEEVEDFIIRWAKEPRKDIILLLDLESREGKEGLLGGLRQQAKIFRFKENPAFNTFSLTRQIEQRKTGNALQALDQLLKEGERPERILGGLRYSLEKSRLSPLEVRRRVRMLVESDMEIKTGRARPVFALEKLIVRLCALRQPLH
ncbi:MAG: hypothetical protein WC478_06615 [Candidatus Omnitrophota bacterium]